MRLIFCYSTFHFGRQSCFFIGYGFCADIDKWLAKRARAKLLTKLFGEEIFGWEPDPNKPEYENWGNLTRRRLTGNDQIIVVRVRRY
jgi:hypothetical protein